MFSLKDINQKIEVHKIIIAVILGYASYEIEKTGWSLLLLLLSVYFAATSVELLKYFSGTIKEKIQLKDKVQVEHRDSSGNLIDYFDSNVG